MSLRLSRRNAEQTIKLFLADSVTLTRTFHHAARSRSDVAACVFDNASAPKRVPIHPRVERGSIVERGPLAAGFLVNFWFRDGSGTLQEIEVTSLISLLNVLHV